MRRVLVIGNAKSVWTKEYILNTHHFLGNKVYVTSYEKLDKEEIDFYREIGVEIISFAASNRVFKMLKCIFKLLCFSIKNKGRIQLIDIQSPPHSHQARLLELIIDIMGGKTITTFWGSDIFCANENSANKMKGILDRSKWINIGSKAMHEKLCSLYGHVYDEKCTFVGFGSPALEQIRVCTLSKTECKKLFNLNEHKISIAVGYNGRKEQQHLDVIGQLAHLPRQYKDQIEFLIHLGYNTPDGYRQEIVDALENTGIEYLILDEMFNLESIAKLRLATDIFIHAQVSDGLSGTIRECVYGGAILVNPVWLRYDKFDSDGVEYIKYENFIELPTIVEKILDDKISINRELNKSLLYNEYSWKAVRHKWMRMFDE